MALSVIVYKYAGEKNRLDKTNFLTDGITTTAEIKGVFRADAPEMHLNYAGGQLNGYNYLRVEIATGVYFYYYATITAELGQTYRASCTRDPLMTFKEDLKKCGIIARRTGKTGSVAGTGAQGYNSFLADPLHPILQSTTSYDKKLTDGSGEAALGYLYNGSYIWHPLPILVTVG